MVKQYPELERGESASQTGREHIPPRIFKEMTQLTQQKEQLDALLVVSIPSTARAERRRSARCWTAISPMWHG